MIMYAFLTGPLAGVSGYCHEACFENSEEILRKRFPPPPAGKARGTEDGPAASLNLPRDHGSTWRADASSVAVLR